MAVGKNKIERWMTINFDDSGGVARDLSSALVPGTINGIGQIFDEAELTGVSEAHKNFMAGHWSSEITAQFYVDDTASTGAFTVLIGQAGSDGTLTIALGAGAAPTSGDPEWEGEYALMELPLVLAGNKPVLACRFVPFGSVAPAWGTV